MILLDLNEDFRISGARYSVLLNDSLVGVGQNPDFNVPLLT